MHNERTNCDHTHQYQRISKAHGHSKTVHQSIAADVPSICRDKYHILKRATVEQAPKVNEAAETMAARAGAGAQGEAKAEGNRKQAEN